MLSAYKNFPEHFFIWRGWKKNKRGMFSGRTFLGKGKKHQLKASSGTWAWKQASVPRFTLVFCVPHSPPSSSLIQSSGLKKLTYSNSVSLGAGKTGLKLGWLWEAFLLVRLCGWRAFPIKASVVFFIKALNPRTNLRTGIKLMLFNGVKRD